MELNYQIIVDNLQSIIPVQWKNVIFMAEYTLGSYSMRCFYDIGDGKYHDCMLHVSGGAKVHLIKVYKDIDREIQNVRRELENDKIWYAITLKFNANGNFKAEYDYNPHDENAIEYIETWKNKYL